MSDKQAEIIVRGKSSRVPSGKIQGLTVVVKGHLLKIASIHDELIEESHVSDPDRFVMELRKRVRADIFTFSQRLYDGTPHFDYPFEWDNVAAIPITTFDDWFKKRAAVDVRQNVRKAPKRGVSVRTSPLDDALVQGIFEVFNEDPVRQGRRFWHYGKDLATVRREISHCVERSEFVCAYCGDELIGFIKLIYTGNTASIVVNCSKHKHFEKRAPNALMAKTIEVCQEKGMAYLTYAKYAYGKKANSSLADFKRRNGFEPLQFPRYYVPLTSKGRLAVRLKLYRGIQELLPESVQHRLLRVRSQVYKRIVLPLKLARKTAL